MDTQQLDALSLDDKRTLVNAVLKSLPDNKARKAFLMGLDYVLHHQVSVASYLYDATEDELPDA